MSKWLQCAVLNYVISFFSILNPIEVAVKMLKDINDPAVEEEMERELNTIAKLDHENIVRIYGVFSVADTGNTGKLNILSESFQVMHYL